MDPETYDRILSLRVTREFQERPLTGDELDAILEAGRWTGSSKNVQGWVFVVIEGQRSLDSVAEAGRFTDPVRNSAATIALVRTAAGSDFDIGRAAQNMMLAADTMGIGSCPITLHDAETAGRVLALGSDEECRWVIAFGFPDRQREAESRERRRASGMAGRRAREEVFRRLADQDGQPRST